MITKRNFLFTSVYAANIWLIAQPAMAGTASSSFPVNATISTVCALGASPMSFGEVNVSGVATSQTDSASALTVTCTNGGSYSVSLDGGVNGVAAQRSMASESNRLNYDLYQDAARGTVWTNATAPQAGIGNGAVQTIALYGRIAAGLPFTAGSYTDTINVTITY